MTANRTANKLYMTNTQKYSTGIVRIALQAFILLFCLSSFAQNTARIVKGKVTDERGEPLIGAVVMCVENKNAALTDIDGNFYIEVTSSSAEIEASFLGYETMRLPADRDVVNFEMKPSADNTLDDVVVIGYGTTKKEDLTGSVATLDMKGIDMTPVSSIDQAMQGKISGVDIMSTSGDPSAGTSIRIRGTRSITASNEPLIIVNGVMDAVEDIKDIDPADIKSLSVLKDASATAIYGSRGSNGVIIITTKDGSGSGKIKVNLSAQCGVSMLARKLDLMDKNEFIQYRNDYRFIDAFVVGSSPSAVYDPNDYENNTDWLASITRPAPYSSVNLSLSGSEKNHQYYASANFTDQEGIIKNSGFKRISLMFNTRRQFTKWLSLRLSISGSFRIEKPNNAIIGGTDNAGGAIYLSPVIGPYDRNNPLIENSAPINTPVACIELIEKKKNKFSNTDALTVTLTPVKGLKIESQNSLILFQMHQYNYWPSTMPKKTEKEGADAQRIEGDNIGFSTENTVNYKIGVRNHNFDVMAGFSAQQKSGNSLSIKAVGLVSDYLKWNNMNAVTSKENYTVTSSASKVVRESAFARFNYDYASKYYLTVTFRADGSSNFAANRKWGFFPSAAIKWNAKKENFLKNEHWLSALDLRLSYGRTGNDSLTSFRAIQAYESTTDSYLFDGVQGSSFYPVRLSSPDLSWEKTDMFNVALEASFIHDRIRLLAEYYFSRTSDLLLSVKTIQSTGYKSRFENLGITRNSGVEFTLETRNIERRKFGWNTVISLSHNSQRVDDIGQESYVPMITAPSGYMMYGYKAGYPLNSLWGFEYAGVFKSAEEFDRNQITRTYACQQSYTRNTCLGRPKYTDQDHDGVISMNDLVYLGNADPVVYGGVQNDFYIGKLSLSVFLAYSIGGKIYNYSEIYMSGGQTANQYRYMKEAWHPERNPDSDLPRAGHSQTTLPCTLLVHDASFLRLKNVTLSYRFDIRKTWMKSVTLSLSGENLFLWTKYNGFDPDVSTESEDSALRRVDLGAYPKSRTVTAGVKVNF